MVTSHHPEDEEVQEPWFRPGESKGSPERPLGPGGLREGGERLPQTHVVDRRELI